MLALKSKFFKHILQPSFSPTPTPKTLTLQFVNPRILPTGESETLGSRYMSVMKAVWIVDRMAAGLAAIFLD